MHFEILTDFSMSLSDTGVKGIPRKRSFSGYQLSELRKRYKLDPYVVGVEKEAMCKRLGMSERQIENWFKHRRLYDKTKSRPL